MSATIETTPKQERASWTPMVGLFFAQILMSFNVAALPISIGGMVEDFGVPPTVASSTIVIYGLVVAALVMTGAKLGQRIGWVLIFRCVVVVFAGSSLMMIFSPSIGWAVAGQALAGASAAIIVPALVALIAENYSGDQQATAIGSLGSARALSGISAFLIGGTLGLTLGGLLASLISYIGIPMPPPPGMSQGYSGEILITGWGAFFAGPNAPFDIAGISPAPMLIILGVILGQSFFTWTRRRMRDGKIPLVDLSVLASPRERAAVYAMFIVVALEAALNFTVPMYIQIVQGRSRSTSQCSSPRRWWWVSTSALVRERSD